MMGAHAAVVVGGGMGQAMLSVGKDVGKAFAGEAAFFDESITVSVAFFFSCILWRIEGLLHFMRAYGPVWE